MKYIFLLFILSLTVASFASNDQLVFEHLTIEDGLSQSSVKAIFQDSKGFMWFGTRDGLNRYDGYSFKIFKSISGDAQSISSNEINSISEDAEGYIWIATTDGLNRFERRTETFKRIKFDSTSDSDNFRIIESVAASKNQKDNTIWFTNQNGIYKYNVTTNKLKFYVLTSPAADKNTKVLKIQIDSSNNIWVSDFLAGIFKYNAKTDNFDRFFADEISRSGKEIHLSSVYVDKNNNLWYGSVLGLTKHNIKSGTTKRYSKELEEKTGFRLYSGYINEISEDDNENLIITTSGFGFLVFNKKAESFKLFINDPYDNKTPSLNVGSTLYKDRSGIIWIGTNGSGIDRLNPFINKFKTKTKSEKTFVSKSIRCFYEDSEGNFWIAGYRGLDKYSTSTGKYKNYFSQNDYTFPKFCDNAVYSIAEDKDNTRYLYFGTEGSGINRFDKKNETFTKIYPSHFFKGKPGYYVILSIYDDGNGNLWFGTNHALVKMNKTSGAVIEYSHISANNNSISMGSITSLCKDSKGTFWVGSSMGGLNIMDISKGTFIHFTHDINNPNSISGNFIKYIYEDRNKTIWVATTTGLNRYNHATKSFKRYNLSHGLPNDVVYGIIEDNDGYLWLSTNLGISKFDPRKEVFRNYTSSDGLQSNEFNTNAFYKNRQGELFFGGINGFNSFFPEEITDNTYIPPVSVTDIRLFNKSIESGKQYDGKVLLTSSPIEAKELELSYSDNVITLEFAALDYVSPNKNLYSYKLEGFDAEWSAPTHNRTVTYTNLEPGAYIFRVRASNGDTWNMRGDSLRIIVTPPFWKTWWFIMFLLLVVAGSYYFLDKRRMHLIEQTNKRLEKEVSERTEELSELNKSLQTEVNERKHAEEELRILNAQKDKFFSIIAHDLKSPFQGLLGYSEVLSEEFHSLSEDEKVSFINDIQNISKNTFRFLENLLEWSRIQTGHLEYQPQMLNLFNETSEICVLLEGYLRQKKITFLNTIDKDSSAYADKNMIHVILRNLISNAIKFTPENGTIKVYSNNNNSHTEIIVEDNGIGIPGKEIDKLFRIDVQYSSKGTNQEKGTGLGLLLCKEMIEKNNGTIKVESVIHMGSKFIFTLPGQNQ